jgi:hypothetical protein
MGSDVTAASAPWKNGGLGWLREPRVRLALMVAATAYLVVRWYLLLTSADPLLGADAYTYWSAPYSNPYPGPELGLPGAYLYPPPFIQILAPLRLLPWEAFHAIWAALGFAALVFLVGPVGGALAVTLLPFVFRDLLVGNIHLLLGAAIVIGLRFPAAWALPILTKITPGIGVLWFAVRREWRRLAIAIGVSAAIAVVSFVATPDLWAAWLARMSDDSGRAGGPYLAILVARVLAAAGIALYAGWRDRAWLLPIAVVVALPILWPDSLSILLACFPLIARDMKRRDPAVRL